MSTYILGLALIGFAILCMAWLPTFSRKLNISYSIVFVALGAVLYFFIDILPVPNPIEQEDYTVRLSELVVIIALMGTGLKIDKPFAFRKWKVPFRLITVTMLLCIAGGTALGMLLGFDFPTSLLFGAVLAPTDPVLATDVQVGPPNEDNEDDTRFALTAEAGMNDGMAFPFVWLAIILFETTGKADLSLFGEWLLRDLLYRILAGMAMGLVIGKIYAYLFFRVAENKKWIKVRDGFVALSATLLVYGLTEMIYGYGFIAVFVCALTIRNYETEHKYHKQLHDFTDQAERILLAIVLMLFGGALVSGILNSLTWPMVAASLVFLLVVRPVAGFIGMIGVKTGIKEKMTVSFFGIRGIGSIFYLAFAFHTAAFNSQEQLWSLVAFTILASLVIHGFSAKQAISEIREIANKNSKAKKNNPIR